MSFCLYVFAVSAWV